MIGYFHSWLRFLVVSGALALLVFALYWGQSVFIPIAIAILFCFVLSPAVSWMQRHGLHRLVAVIIVVGLTLLLLTGIGMALLSQVAHLGNNLPNYKQTIGEKITGLREATKESWMSNLWRTVDDLSQELWQDKEAKKAGSEQEPIPVTVKTTPIPLLHSLAANLLTFLVQAGLVLVLLIFILLQREDLRNRLICLCGNRNLTSTTKALDDAGGRISRYLIMQLLVNGTFGLALGVGLWLIGIPYAFTAGLMGATLRYIPYLGPWISAIFPLFVSLAVFDSWWPLLVVLALILILELVSNNFMEPWLYGQSIGVSEPALLVAAAFWTALWGAPGLVLATPLTACLAVLGKYVPQFAFLDVLLGNQPILAPPVVLFQRLLARDHDEAADLVDSQVRDHPEQNVFDEVVTPALAHALDARKREQISDEDLRAIVQALEEVIQQVELPGHDEVPVARRRVMIHGLSSQDEIDELLLHMLAHMILDKPCRFKILAPQANSADLLDDLDNEKANACCLAVAPAGRLSHAAYICRRLRHQFADMKIIALCWGAPVEKIELKFKSAGVDAVATNLVEAREALDSLIPNLPSKPPEKLVAPQRTS